MNAIFPILRKNITSNLMFSATSNWQFSGSEITSLVAINLHAETINQFAIATKIFVNTTNTFAVTANV